MNNKIKRILIPALLIFVLLAASCSKPATDDTGAPPETDASKLVAEDTGALPETGASEQENEGVANNESKPDKVVFRSSISKYIEPDELISMSDAVFVGKYKGVAGTVETGKDYIEKQHVEVFTDFEFENVKALKGELDDSVFITTPGGQIGDTMYATAEGPRFEKGKSYLIFAQKLGPRVDNDREVYYVVTSNYYEVNEDGSLNISTYKPEDAQAISDYYESHK